MSSPSISSQTRAFVEQEYFRLCFSFFVLCWRVLCTVGVERGELCWEKERREDDCWRELLLFWASVGFLLSRGTVGACLCQWGVPWGFLRRIPRSMERKATLWSRACWSRMFTTCWIIIRLLGWRRATRRVGGGSSIGNLFSFFLPSPPLLFADDSFLGFSEPRSVEKMWAREGKKSAKIIVADKKCA